MIMIDTLPSQYRLLRLLKQEFILVLAQPLKFNRRQSHDHAIKTDNNFRTRIIRLND